MAKELRGDIQGLRAVAVLMVVAAHAGVPFLPGGFVGVDVFFVISGYLIAGLLYREVMLTGQVSIGAFWARRARRILPAATLVTVVTVVASLAWMSLLDARQVVIDALWASAFAANVHFAQQGVFYFAQDTGPSPLQHYWSLASRSSSTSCGRSCWSAASPSPAWSARGRAAGRAAASHRGGHHARRHQPGLAGLVDPRDRRVARPRPTSPPSPEPGSSASAPWSPWSRPRRCAASPG